jgi:hypothetical protein
MNEPLAIVLYLHTASTLAMAGVIWFVQVVHYPLFKRVDQRGFTDYEAGHTRLTSLVVGPLMTAEAVCAVTLTILRPEELLIWVGLGLLFGIWLSTITLQVPLHRRLARGFDRQSHRRLVSTNWLRTVGWTARSAVALVLLSLL